MTTVKLLLKESIKNVGRVGDIVPTTIESRRRSLYFRQPDSTFGVAE